MVIDEEVKKENLTILFEKIEENIMRLGLKK